jgi:glycosyltransferase involved in cell wall biosynthesis
MRKILYIANARIPTEKAHGVQIMKMCEAFAALKIKIELILPRRRNLAKQDPFGYYGIRESFKIKTLPIIDWYEKGSFGFWISSFSFAFAYFFYAWRQKGDAIVYSRDMDQFSFFLLPFLKKAYFIEIHGPKEKGFFYRLLFSRINGVIATNSFNKKKLLENFEKLKNKVIVQPNGVDIEKFSNIGKGASRERLNLAQDKKIVVYAGHFYKWKGIETLIQAASGLKEDVLVYLVGGTENDINRLKKEQDIPRNVIFAGFCGYKEIHYWYAAADLLVLTGTKKDSYSLHHTSPVKLREYMASVRPIVSADTPSIKDAVSEEEVFFYRADDAGNLKEKIEYALSNQPIAFQKAENAKAKAQNYSWGNRAKKIIEFMEKSL